MNVRQALAAAERRLAAAGCDTPGLDARVLLGHVLGRDAAGLIAHDRDPLGDRAQAFEALVRRREHREPVAYLIHHREFFSLPFEVSPAVLVPRPETELVVEEALRWLGEHPRAGTVVDVGTGSGAIAVAVAHELTEGEGARERAGLAPRLRILAVDPSADALSIAARNARRLAGDRRVLLCRSDLTTALDASSVDLLLSNPPYLSVAELDHGAPEVLFEPRLALLGGSADGLDVVRRLLVEARRVLRPGGRLLCEIGCEQGDVARAFARALGFREPEVLRDLAGRPRLLRADSGQAG